MNCRTDTRRARLATALLAAVAGAPAEITAAGPSGFVSEHAVDVQTDRDHTWEALVDNADWWQADHTSGNAANLSLDAQPGGCFCERLAGGGVEHMRVGAQISGLKASAARSRAGSRS